MSDGRVVCFNGNLVPEADARVSIYDSALMFGDMVFEMTRSFAGKQFKLREHLHRLYKSARAVHITVPITIDEMEAAVHQTIAANEPFFAADDEHRVMIDISRGLLGIYEGISGIEAGANVIIADFPLRWTVAGMGCLFDEGINAVIPSQRAIPASLLDPKIKSRSRLHYLTANYEVAAHEGKNNWALLIDPDGFVAEGTGDNFFIVKDGKLITPEGRNILRGISRAYVMDELAPQLGCGCEEANIEPYDVVEADEAFMTGTPFCMLPVVSLNGTAIGNGAMGDVTKALIAAWSTNVEIDIIDQIRRWDAESPDHPTTTSPTPYSFGKRS